jgi:hypothetical protein
MVSLTFRGPRQPIPALHHFRTVQIANSVIDGLAHGTTGQAASLVPLSRTSSASSPKHWPSGIRIPPFLSLSPTTYERTLNYRVLFDRLVRKQSMRPVFTLAVVRSVAPKIWSVMEVAGVGCSGGASVAVGGSRPASLCSCSRRKRARLWMRFDTSCSWGGATAKRKGGVNIAFERKGKVNSIIKHLAERLWGTSGAQIGRVCSREGMQAAARERVAQTFEHNSRGHFESTPT